MLLLGISISLALLVGAAGAGKLVDPRHTAGALAAVNLPHSWNIVRAFGLLEVTIAVLVVGVGGVLPTALLAGLYAGFAVFVVLALQSDTPLSSCGCFGAADTPPGAAHLVVNVVAMLALSGLAMSKGAVGLRAAAISDLPVILSGVVLGYLLYALLSVRPRSLA